MLGRDRRSLGEMEALLGGGGCIGGGGGDDHEPARRACRCGFICATDPAEAAVGYELAEDGAKASEGTPGDVSVGRGRGGGGCGCCAAIAAFHNAGPGGTATVGWTEKRKKKRPPKERKERVTRKEGTKRGGAAEMEKGTLGWERSKKMSKQRALRKPERCPPVGDYACGIARHGIMVCAGQT